MGIDAAESELLSKCPFCDYSLRGLPILHKCPECGQPFDRRWRQFGGVSRWASMTARQRWITILGDLVCVGICWCWLGGRVRADPWVALVFMLPALTVQVGLPLLLSFRSADFVVIGPDGIGIGNRKSSRLQHLPWCEIRDADFRSGGGAVFHCAGGDVVPDGLLPDQAQRCVDFVKAWIEDHGQNAWIASREQMRRSTPDVT